MISFPAFDGSQNCAQGRIDPDRYYGDEVNGRLPRMVKAICNGCPFIDPCLEWGLHHEHFGLWGGTDDRERNVIRKERGIVAGVPVMRIVEGMGKRRGPAPRKAS